MREERTDEMTRGRATLAGTLVTDEAWLIVAPGKAPRVELRLHRRLPAGFRAAFVLELEGGRTVSGIAVLSTSGRVALLKSDGDVTVD